MSRNLAIKVKISWTMRKVNKYDICLTPPPTTTTKGTYFYNHLERTPPQVSMEFFEMNTHNNQIGIPHMFNQHNL